jgi:hypothetical protein
MDTTLHDFWACFDRAWDSHRADAVAAYFEERCILSFIDGRQFAGRKEIKEFYQDAFSKMPSGLIHRATVEEEAGLTGRGSFRISSPVERLNVLVGHYEIEFSTQRLILRLTLRRTQPNHSPEPTPDAVH